MFAIETSMPRSAPAEAAAAAGIGLSAIQADNLTKTGSESGTVP